MDRKRIRKAKENKWNQHVREAVQAGGRRRVYRVLTAAVWALMLGAVGFLFCQAGAQRAQLEQLREEQRNAQIAAAREQAQLDALRALASELEADKAALQTELETARQETLQARQALAEARIREEPREEEGEEEIRTPLAGGPAYTALYPDLYAAPAERETLVEDGIVYLTFDDGPSDRTAEVLDILKENDIKATFFVTGQTGEQAQEMMRRIVDEGHTIAIHTYTHNYQEIYASVEGYLADFDRIYNWVYEVTGVYPQIFRFPGGTINSYNGDIWRELVDEMDRRGFVHYDWNALCGDADGKPHTAEELARNALAKVGANRVFVLMHDSVGHAATVECLPAVIEGYRGAGYSFAALTPEVKAVTFD